MTHYNLRDIIITNERNISLKRGVFMKKNILSIGNQIKYLKTLNGIAWILTGIFDMFNNTYCTIATIVCIVCSVFLVGKVHFSTKEQEDEMAIENLKDAIVSTHMIMNILFCTAIIVVRVITIFSFSQNINWENLIVPAFFIILGIENLLIGLKFNQLEKE